MIASEFRMLLAESGMTDAMLAERLQILEEDVMGYRIGVLPIPLLVEYAFLWIINIENAEVFLSGN